MKNNLEKVNIVLILIILGLGCCIYYFNFNNRNAIVLKNIEQGKEGRLFYNIDGSEFFIGEVLEITKDGSDIKSKVEKINENKEDVYLEIPEDVKIEKGKKYYIHAITSGLYKEEKRVYKIYEI